MNKNELTFKELVARGDREARYIDFGKSVALYLLIGYCTKVFFETLLALGSNEASSLIALSGLIKSMNLANIVHSLVTLGFGSAWYLERKGKRRAVKKLGKYRKAEEASDPHHESSDLDEDGDTPKRI